MRACKLLRPARARTTARGAMSAHWMRELQQRVKRAGEDAQVAMQPRVALAKRSLEEGMHALARGKDPMADAPPELRGALAAVDELRAVLRRVAAGVEAHRASLIAVAESERALGHAFLDVAGVCAEMVGPERLDVMVGGGEAEAVVGGVLGRFALDMSTPMADLSRTFEEAYVAKIVPLKKKYASQKAEYLKYLRQAAATEDESKRHNLEAMAVSAKPVWEQTAETLQAEIQSLAAYTASNLSEWSLNVAQAEADTFQRAARALEGPAHQAEAIQNAPPS